MQDVVTSGACCMIKARQPTAYYYSIISGLMELLTRRQSCVGTRSLCWLASAIDQSIIDGTSIAAVLEPSASFVLPDICISEH